MNKLAKYSEGDAIEEKFLKAFRSNDKVELDKMLHSGVWNYRYHLSDVRENILNWYEFKKGSQLLEVGAGMGAVTGAFLDKGLNVYSLELEDRRADILEARWKGFDNLTIVRGNILDYHPDQKYDYVVCIGVLEYSGRFVTSSRPYLKFINKLKDLLSPGGKVIIAIENRYGLKYWTGAPEDHTGKYFDGLENYSHERGVKTFSKDEITRLLNESGLNELQFFYPLPDYKFPLEIFSDNYLPTLKHNISPNLLLGAPVNARQFLMNERRVFDGIIDNDKFRFFSNSFLIFAGI